MFFCIRKPILRLSNYLKCFWPILFFLLQKMWKIPKFIFLISRKNAVFLGHFSLQKQEKWANPICNGTSFQPEISVKNNKRVFETVPISLVLKWVQNVKYAFLFKFLFSLLSCPANCFNFVFVSRIVLFRKLVFSRGKALMFLFLFSVQISVTYKKIPQIFWPWLSFPLFWTQKRPSICNISQQTICGQKAFLQFSVVQIAFSLVFPEGSVFYLANQVADLRASMKHYWTIIMKWILQT